jgi:hypothetical protein
MNIAHLTLALCATATLLGSEARANLGDTDVQSANRYGRAFHSSATSSGILRLYYTLDRKYLVQQLFTPAGIVETICYIKMGNTTYTPGPLTPSELNALRSANIPENTTFPATSLALAKDAEDEKVWRSDDGQFYMDVGKLSAKDCPFGVPVDCIVFATSSGYDHLQILMNK